MKLKKTKEVKARYIINMRALAQARMRGDKQTEANCLWTIRSLGYVQS